MVAKQSSLSNGRQAIAGDTLTMCPLLLKFITVQKPSPPGEGPRACYPTRTFSMCAKRTVLSTEFQCLNSHKRLTKESSVKIQFALWTTMSSIMHSLLKPWRSADQEHTPIASIRTWRLNQYFNVATTLKFGQTLLSVGSPASVKTEANHLRWQIALNMPLI